MGIRRVERGRRETKALGPVPICRHRNAGSERFRQALLAGGSALWETKAGGTTDSRIVFEPAGAKLETLAHVHSESVQTSILRHGSPAMKRIPATLWVARSRSPYARVPTKPSPNPWSRSFWPALIWQIASGSTATKPQLPSPVCPNSTLCCAMSASDPGVRATDGQSGGKFSGPRRRRRWRSDAGQRPKNENSARSPRSRPWGIPGG